MNTNGNGIVRKSSGERNRIPTKQGSFLFNVRDGSDSLSDWP